MTASDTALAIALASGQTFGVLWLVRLGIARGGNWASATFVTAVAWAPLFLAPCWIYALDPGLLTTTNAPAQPIAIVDVSLFALIAGLLAVRLRGRKPQPPDLVEVVDPPAASRRVLIGFAILGIACLGLLVARNGGPVAYVSSQYNAAQLNRGLLYLVWGVLFLRYASLAAVASRWARGRPAPRGLIAYLALGCGVALVMGAREFLAVAAVQVLLTAALIRRRPRLRSFTLPALLVAVLLVFGLGAVKLYQGYSATHPHGGLGFAGFVEKVAPDQALNDYANNYVSGVSLIGLARRIVPAQADYEYGKVLLRFLVTPIPRPFRPNVSQQPLIQAAFSPPGGFTYAVPLQATAYLEFGIAGVAVAFFALGALLAVLDRALARPRQRSLRALLTLVTLAVQIPVLLRGGIPAGLVFLLMDVIGVWVAATLLGGRRGLRTQITRASSGRRRRAARARRGQQERRSSRPVPRPMGAGVPPAPGRPPQERQAGSSA